MKLQDYAEVQLWGRERNICLICFGPAAEGPGESTRSSLCEEHFEGWRTYKGFGPEQFLEYIEEGQEKYSNLCASCNKRFQSETPAYLCPSCH